jgi:O-antigen ligase
MLRDSDEMLRDKLFRSTEPLLVLAVVLVAALIGAAVPLYVGAVGDGIGRLAALPVLIPLCFLLVLSPQQLLLIIVLFRAAADLAFETTKLSVGEYQIGLGGVINACVLLIAVLLCLERPGRIPMKAIVVMWTPFLLTALLGTFLSPVKVEALRTCLGLLSNLAIFAGAFYLVRSPQDFRRCVRIIVWSSLIPAAYAFIDIGLNWSAGGAFRLQSTFSHPNIFAFYLTLIIALTFYVLKTPAYSMTTGKRLGLTAYLLLLLFFLLLTQTRSAWTACFAGFCAYGVFFERRYLAYVILVPLLALWIPGIQERLVDLASGNDYVQYAQLNSFAWRRLMWESGLRWMQADHYLFGYGVASFKHYSPAFFPLAGNANFGAHNVYVQWLFEAGVAGLLAYLWCHGQLLRWLKSMSSVDKLGAFISMALVIEYLVVSWSDNVLAYLVFNWYFWFIAGAGCAVSLAVSRGRAFGDDSQLIDRQTVAAAEHRA